jgi:hypothetical protein
MNTIEKTQATKPAAQTPKFFHYSQNNSGGSFDIDDSVAHHVIIQAVSAQHADQIAIDIGIYFDGCENGQDCSCCGDRWYSAQGDEGTEAPLLYGKPPEEYKDMFGKPGLPVCHVYHLDGSKTTYRAPPKKETP